MSSALVESKANGHGLTDKFLEALDKVGLAKDKMVYNQGCSSKRKLTSFAHHNINVQYKMYIIKLLITNKRLQ
jgi:hypothetical protein